MSLSSVLGGQRGHQEPPETHATLNYSRDKRMGHKVPGSGREDHDHRNLCICGLGWLKQHKQEQWRSHVFRGHVLPLCSQSSSQDAHCESN